jgi:hypothetical protein
VRSSVIAQYEAVGFVLLETLKIRADIWLRFQCVGR